VVGSIKVIDNFSYNALRRFYKKWYTPEAQCVIIVGDIDPDAVEKALKTLFADIPKSESTTPLAYSDIPDNKNPLITVVTDKELTETTAQLLFKKPALSVADKQTVRAAILGETDHMICWMLNQRLEAMSKKPNAPFIKAVVERGNYYITSEKQTVVITVTCKDGKILNGLQVAYIELLRAVRFGFTQEEQQRYTNEFQKYVNGNYSFRDHLNNDFFSPWYVVAFIENQPSYSNTLKYFQIAPLFLKLAPEQMQMRLQEYVMPDNRVVYIKAPETQIASLPTEKQIINTLDSADRKPLSLYRETSTTYLNKPLIAQLPNPGHIVEEQPFSFNSTRFVLSNGAKVIVKRVDCSRNVIKLSAVRSGGQSLYENKDVITARLASQVVSSGGLGEFSNTDIKNYLSNKIVDVTACSDSLYDYINGTTGTGDLETMLQLAYLKFTSSRKDRDAFEVWKAGQKQAIRNGQNSSYAAARDSVFQELYNNNDRVRDLKEADIESVDYDHCLTIDRERYKDASDFTFYIVGDVNMEQIPSLISKYIASLPADSTKEHWINRNIVWNGTHCLRIVQKLETPQTLFSLGYHAKVPYSFRNQLILNLLAKVMRMEYMETIREEKGGTYDVAVMYNQKREPEQMAELQIQYLTDPKKENILTALIYSKIQELMATGIDANKLNRAKSVLRTQHEKDIRDNQYWLSCLKIKDHFNEDCNTSFESILNGISPSEIQNLLKTLTGQKDKMEFILSSE
ncbi:MAG: insulinase family protein, partial [Bacteroidaceae bacterium]